MARKACCPKEGINRGAWTSHEDRLLMDYIALHGLGRWGSLPKNAGLKRCGKSCRLRWLNYLRPDIKRGNITEDEEELIIRLHKLLGNRWSLIAGRIPGRTDNEIKNYWNTCLRKKISGECLKQRDRPKSKTKKGRQENLSTIEKHVDVIRTKAVRCTKLVMPEQTPAHLRESCSITNNHIPSDYLSDNSDMPINFNMQGESSSLLDEIGISGFCLPEIMESSPLMHVSTTTSNYMNLDGSNCSYGLFGTHVDVDDSYCLNGLYNYDGRRDMSPCFEEGIWDSLMLPKI